MMWKCTWAKPSASENWATYVFEQPVTSCRARDSRTCQTPRPAASASVSWARAMTWRRGTSTSQPGNAVSKAWATRQCSSRPIRSRSGRSACAFWSHVQHVTPPPRFAVYHSRPIPPVQVAEPGVRIAVRRGAPVAARGQRAAGRDLRAVREGRAFELREAEEAFAEDLEPVADGRQV